MSGRAGDRLARQSLGRSHGQRNMNIGFQFPGLGGLRKPCAWLLVVAAFTGLLQNTAQADDAPPRQVVVAPVRSGELVQQLEVRGSVTAPRTAQVAAGVAGLLRQVDVEEGARVRSGQRLARLDAEIDRQDQRVASAALAEAEVAVAEAQRRLQDARDIGAGFFPADEMRSRESAVNSALALVQRRQAELRRQEAVLARHDIKAPFSGVVSTRHRQVGEWVEPGTALMELVDLDSLRLEFALPQALFGRVGPRTVLQVQIDSEPGQLYAGRVRAVIPVSDPASRNFRLRASLEGQAPPLTPGMSARATLRLPSGRTGVSVPRDALNRYADGRVTVWVLDPRDGQTRVREQRITLDEASSDGDHVATAEGLRGDEQVVVRGNEALRNGQRVAAQR